MPAGFTPYLDALRGHLHLGAATEASVLRELSTHLEDRTHEFMERGLPRNEAVAEATRTFGNPQRIAAALSFVHNQGTWQEVGLSALPHLLVALLFASHRWLEVEWLLGALLLTAGVGAIGWLRKRSLWAYPWMGFALFPVLLAGTVSLASLGHATWSVLAWGYTPTSPLSWIVGLTLSVLGVVLVAYLVVWVSRRDWVHAALLVMPIPVLSVALLAFDRGGYARLEEADTQTALLFVLVALSVGLFVRVASRPLKAGILGGSLPLAFLISSPLLEGELRVTIALLLSLPAVLLVLTPFLPSLGTRRTYSDELPSPMSRPRRPSKT